MYTAMFKRKVFFAVVYWGRDGWDGVLLRQRATWMIWLQSISSMKMQLLSIARKHGHGHGYDIATSAVFENWPKIKLSVWPEDIAIWTILDTIHGPWLQVHQNWHETQVFHNLLHLAHVHTLRLKWRVCSVETSSQNLAPIWFPCWPPWMMNDSSHLLAERVWHFEWSVRASRFTDKEGKKWRWEGRVVMMSWRLIKWVIEELAISYISIVFDEGQIIILCSAVRTHNYFW